MLRVLACVSVCARGCCIINAHLTAAAHMTRSTDFTHTHTDTRDRLTDLTATLPFLSGTGGSGWRVTWQVGRPSKIRQFLYVTQPCLHWTYAVPGV